MAVRQLIALMLALVGDEATRERIFTILGATARGAATALRARLSGAARRARLNGAPTAGGPLPASTEGSS
jgi:hypothetical protein